METREKKTSETFRMKGSWETQTNHLKGKFPTLTDADLKFETGKESELLSRLGTKLDKTPEEIISIIQNGQPEDGQSEKVQQPEKVEESARAYSKSL